MRRPALLIFVNFAILIVVFTMLTQALFIVQRVAVTEDPQRPCRCTARRPGHLPAAEPQQLCQDDDVVRAEGDGMAEFKWADGTRLRLTPNTQLTINKVSYNSLQKADNSQFKLTSGKVYVRIVKVAFDRQSALRSGDAHGRGDSARHHLQRRSPGRQTEVAVYKGEVKVTSSAGKNVQEKTIEPGQVAFSAKQGSIQTQKESVEKSQFESQPSIVRPDLTAEVKPASEAGAVLVTGQTEAGNKVTVNGKAARVLGNGTFRLRVEAQPGQNRFVIISTDKHGAASSVTHTLAPQNAQPGPARSDTPGRIKNFGGTGDAAVDCCVPFRFLCCTRFVVTFEAVTLKLFLLHLLSQTMPVATARVLDRILRPAVFLCLHQP
jgi:hypothetical protein